MTEKMKPSGITWIGDIPETWKVKKLRFILDENGIKVGPFGSSISNGDYCDEGKWVYNQRTVLDDEFSIADACISEEKYREMIGFKVNAGDMLITSRGTIGKIAIVPEGAPEGVLHPCIIKFSIDREQVVDKLLKRVFNETAFIREQLGYLSNATTIEVIYSYTLKDVYLPIAPIDEQRSIADFLDAQCAKIDSIIADIEKQIETLQKYKKSLITETVTKGLDKAVSMKDSGIEWVGKIPAGWKTSRVKYLIDDNHPYPIGDGDHGMIKADDYLDEGIPYIRVLNLTWGDGLNLDNLVFISDKMNAMIKNSELRPNDILIAKTGATIGKTAIVPESLPVSNTTSHVGKITLPDTHCAKYFFYMMTSNVVQKQIQDISAMQSTRPELGIEGMRDLIVVVPPLKTQERIAKYLDERCAKTDEILRTKKEQLDIVKKHKASIVYEYVTGKKRVTEVN